MKKWSVCLVLLFLLSGCSGPPKEMERGLELRSRLLQAEGCSFDARITADYGDKIHTFSQTCKSDAHGNLTFTVTEPDTISEITGMVSEDGGRLTFDDTALHFELLADDQLSPVSAPWILIKTIRSGYMTSACMEDGMIRLSIDDSYDDEALHLDIWLNDANLPEKADILYDGRRILSVSVTNFQIL